MILIVHDWVGCEICMGSCPIILASVFFITQPPNQFRGGVVWFHFLTTNIPLAHREQKKKTLECSAWIFCACVASGNVNP